jgi:hypothetical protein
MNRPTQQNTHVVTNKTANTIHPTVDTSDFQIGGLCVPQYGQENAGWDAGARPITGACPP